jgi:hypothetical protein
MYANKNTFTSIKVQMHNFHDFFHGWMWVFALGNVILRGVNGRPNVRFNRTVIGHRTVIERTRQESDPSRTYRTFKNIL